MAETTKKPDERRAKREAAEGEKESETPPSRREVKKTYRFDDWASI